MIETAPFPEQSVALLLAIETHTDAPGKTRVAFLKRLHERYPRDFWINLRLGMLLLEVGRPAEAVGYYQTALAIRPGMALAHNNLGSALTRTNRSGEAIGHYRQAIALDPSGVASHLNLALDLRNLGRKDEAIRGLSTAIRLNPSSAVLHTLLGRILELNNQPGEALDQHRQAVALDPRSTEAHRELRGFLRRQGRVHDAWVAWETALDDDPSEHDAWYGYAEFCLFLGRKEDNLRARRALFAKFGATNNPLVAERTSRTCLLRPEPGPRTDVDAQGKGVPREGELDRGRSSRLVDRPGDEGECIARASGEECARLELLGGISGVAPLRKKDRSGLTDPPWSSPRKICRPSESAVSDQGRARDHDGSRSEPIVRRGRYVSWGVPRRPASRPSTVAARSIR